MASKAAKRIVVPFKSSIRRVLERRTRMQNTIGRAANAIVEQLEMRALMTVSITHSTGTTTGGVPQNGGLYPIAMQPDPGQMVSFSITANTVGAADAKFTTISGSLTHVSQGLSSPKLATISGGGGGDQDKDSETSMNDAADGTYYDPVYYDSNGQSYQVPRFKNGGNDDPKVVWRRNIGYLGYYGEDKTDYAFRTITVKKSLKGDEKSATFNFSYGGAVFDIKAGVSIDGFSSPISDTCDNSTNDPVRYADGAARLQFSDFLPTNNSLFSPNLTWSNKSYSADDQPASFGDGMSLGGVPYLQDLTPQMGGAGVNEMGPGCPSGFAVINSSTSAYAVYQDYGDQYLNVADGEDGKSVFANESNTIVQTDPDGTQTVYANFGSNWTPNEKGRMLSRSQPSGESFSVQWDSDPASDIDRPEYYRTISKATSGSGYVVNQFSFNYDEDTGQVASVSQWQGNVSSPDAELNTTGMTPARTVEYKYYTDYDVESAEDNDTVPNGLTGDLKYVVVHDGDVDASVLSTKYYRWDVQSQWDNNPDTGVQLLKSVIGGDAYLKAVHDLHGAANVEAAPDSGSGSLDAYVDNYFEYDSQNRVVTEKASKAGAGCSCGLTGIGTYTFSYHDNPSPEGGYNAWKTRTTVTTPDGNENIVYTNGSGGVILMVTQDVANGQRYSTWKQYDSNGNVVKQASGNAIATYNPSDPSSFESFPDLVGFGQSGSKLIVGQRVEYTNYFGASDTADTAKYEYEKSTGYATIGFNGSINSGADTESWTYSVGGVGDANNDGIDDDGIYNVATDTTYPVAGSTSGERVTSYTYSYWQVDGVNTAQVKSTTTSLSQISTAENGAGSSTANQTKVVFDTSGRVVWSVDGSGFINYTAYDPLSGAVLTQVQDVEPTTITGAPVAFPGTRSPSLPAALNLTTTYLVDSHGRQTKATDPNGNVTYKIYDDTTADGDPRKVLTYHGWNATTHQPTGPVTVTVDDPATGIHDTLTYTATSYGYSGDHPTGSEWGGSGVTIRSLSRSIRNVSDQVVETQKFTSFSGLTYDPTVTTSWATLGTAGTNYLSTKYKYDGGGRQYQTTTPDGTITTNVYDARGLVLSTWKGTNNAGATNTDEVESHLVGTGSGNNMVKVASYTYDDDGNQLTSTQYADAGTSYTTHNTYDFRDRLVDSRGADHIATKYAYDNLDEQTETDTYADGSDYGTIDPGEWFGKTTTAYDDQGQVYRSSVYQGDRTLMAGTLVSSGTTATVTLPTHGFVTGQQVTIAGADQAAYDGTFTVTVTDANTFTYTMAATAAAAMATGSRITVVANKRLTTNYWYDPRGNLVKTQSPSGLLSKTFYDGAGRVVRDTTSADPTEVASGTYDDATTLTGDKVIQQDDYKLDADGNTRIATTWQRDGNDTTSTGAATPANDDHTSVASFYDAANRLTATEDFGRDGSEAGGTRDVWSSAGGYVDANSNGTPDVLETTPGLDNAASATSYDWIYTGYAYDAAGRLEFTTDNANRKVKTEYDFAGRKTAMIENYVDGVASETETDTDRTTQYAYDAQGRLSTDTALNPLGSGLGVQSQVTRFVYASDIDRSWVSATLYGDTTSTVSYDTSGKGTVSGGDAVVDAYDRLGRKVTETDQRGVEHNYAYDTAGRLEYDSVGVLPTGVDGTVRSIGYAYDDEGRQSAVTSYGGTAATGTVVNTVTFGYDAWGNVISDAQQHDANTTGTIQYVYADGSGTGTEAKYVRLAETLYPDHASSTEGSFVTDYGTDDVNAALVRSIGTSDAASHALVRYAYLGLSQIIKTSRPQVGGGLNMTAGTQANHYSGLDRYGRWHELVWTNDADTRRTEDRVYTYDRMGNRLVSDSAAYDDTYAYDGLNRLVEWHQGILSGGSIPSYYDFRNESWTLDALGNWRTQTDDIDGEAGTGSPSRTAAARTVNGANEITSDTGVNHNNGYPVSPAGYDASGNVTASGRTNNASLFQLYYYDAWNRMTGSYGQSQTVGQGLVYDGLGRLIRKIVADGSSNGTSEDYFYNEADQVIELRAGTVLAGVVAVNAHPRERDLWDASYVNAPAQMEFDDNSDGTVDRRLYATWDANHNITALVAPHGHSVERYLWEPYGNDPYALNGAASYDGATEVLNGEESYSGSPDEGGDYTYDGSGTDYADFHLGFQGMRWDPDSWTNLTQTRRYLPQLGTFGGRDPLGTNYQDGYDLYSVELNNPEDFTDPSGLKSVEDWTPFEAYNWWQFAGGGESVQVYGQGFMSNVQNDPQFQSEMANSIYPQIDTQARQICKSLGKNQASDFSRTFSLPTKPNGKAMQMPGFRWYGFGSVYYTMNAHVIVTKNNDCHCTVSTTINVHGYDHYHSFVTSGKLGGIFVGLNTIENVGTGGGWLYGRSFSPKEYNISWDFTMYNNYAL